MPHASLAIARATPADLDALAPLFDAYRQFYSQPSGLAAARAFLAERIGRKESVIFIARSTGAAAGFVQLYPTFSSVSLSNRWILNDLFVDPAFRRHGIARALMLHATDFARSSGATGLMLLTDSTNTSAQRLYESLGWTRDERFWRYTITV